MRSKAWLSICLCILCLTGAAGAEVAFSGVVAARESAAVTSPIGGSVETVLVRAGDWVEAGETVARVAVTGVYAPTDGAVRGLAAEAGDSAGETVLSIAPLSKYTVNADISDAYDSAANKYVTVGETVYMECARDGSHVAVGRVVKAEGSKYTVEVTGGELYMEETVYIATRTIPPPRASAAARFRARRSWPSAARDAWRKYTSMRAKRSNAASFSLPAWRRPP